MNNKLVKNKPVSLNPGDLVTVGTYNDGNLIKLEEIKIGYRNKYYDSKGDLVKNNSPFSSKDVKIIEILPNKCKTFAIIRRLKDLLKIK
jgi:hypothetical protein